MILVELVRLILVLTLTAAGYRMGQNPPQALGDLTSPETAVLLFSVVGAGIGYVLGGVLGRTVLSGIGAVEQKVAGVAAAELLVGGVGAVVGAALGLLLAWPAMTLIASDLIAFPAAAFILVISIYAGYRMAVRKRFDVLDMFGLRAPTTFRAPVTQTAVGARVLDSSAVIDGRILEVAKAGFFAGHVVCPRFVLGEIQSIADSADPVRRSRGRRGLEVLEALQGDPKVRLEVSEEEIIGVGEVDAKLIELTKRLEGVLVTTDFNLHRTAELQGIPVLNVNNLAASLKPAVVAGEKVIVRILREGTGEGQGVGYLDDGTMVVVERAAGSVGLEVEASVTSVLQTASGRMLFASPPAGGTTGGGRA